MNIPDIIIECLRCTATQKLDPGAIQKDATGRYQPINVRRPENWIAGPAPVTQVTRGICPRCAPDWNALAGQFLESEPSDPAVNVRPQDPPPISFEAKKHDSLTHRVGPHINTTIPRTTVDAAQPRITSIPQRAQPVAQPQRNLGSAPPPATRTAVPQNSVTMAPTRTILVAPNVHATKITRTPVVAAPIHVSPTTLLSQPVQVVQNAGVAAPVAATTMNRVLGNVSAPMPIPNVIPAAGGGGSPSAAVTISEPVPIEAK